MNQIKKYFFFLIFINACFLGANNNIQKDSIKFFIQKSKKAKFNYHDKISSLEKAFFLSKKIPLSRLKCKHLTDISFLFYKLKDSLNFQRVNKEAYESALELKDSFYIAESHWNFGDFYNKNEIYDKAFKHYNEALKYFEKVNKINESGNLLYAMAYIKGRYRDYQSSEILTFRAIKKFKKIKNYNGLYNCYTHLGLLQKDIKEYDKALFYYNKSLVYYNRLKEKKGLGNYNNIANIYFKKKEYTKAIQYYNKSLKKKLKRKRFARILNNRANCKLFSKDTTGIKEDLFIALKIRDSLNNRAGIVNSKIHLSDYYSYLKDTTRAIIYAREANILAKQIKNGGDYLTTLKQLANLDVKNSKKYLDRYIVFNDSLISEERKARNKFTRIEFETDEYIEEAEKLTQQNLLITISSIGTILVLSLLYFIRVQKVKNEKLRLEADQQKANEEVYVLTLQQQAKLEEERVNERNRISAELHDGILGKLFGTRVSLGFLGMQMNSDTQEKHQTFLEDLQVIEKEIRDVSHKLSENFDDSTVNFSSIIAQLLKDKSIIGNFKYEYIADKTIVWKSIDEVTKANVYRIIQESLQNIIKHAKAKKVILEFSIANTSIIISLKDDGVGFNTKKSKNGIGLKNITSRIKKLNGTLVLTSKVNKGTLLSITIPYITQ